MSGDYLNNDIINGMKTEHLREWRANIVEDLAKLTTYLAQIDSVLWQRDER